MLVGVDDRAGLLVIGHGSRRPEANEVVLRLVEQLAATGRWRRVQAAFLELARPGIGEGFAALAEVGCRTVVVHPYFLFAGQHTTVDIPAALVRAEAAHPGIDWIIT